MEAAAVLADRVRAGDVRAIARAMSIVDDESPAAAGLVAALHPHGGRARLVGITGSPGAGKSTLVDSLIGELRRRQRRVGVIAVDPTSPFSGGAVLGDRVRMQAHASDPGVFIRSLATRGQLGGLARSTGDVAAVLDAAGFDDILMETVGVGQDEVEIARAADVTVVVLVPGAGDDVQALKAGIMEIADVFVVNKADVPGAERTAASVRMLLGMSGADAQGWRPPIVLTDARSGRGVAELVDAVERFADAGQDIIAARRGARSGLRVRTLVTVLLMRELEDTLVPGELDRVVAAVSARRLDPYTAARLLAARIVASPDTRHGG
jgi:LAO/AO transport system kinase